MLKKAAAVIVVTGILAGAVPARADDAANLAKGKELFASQKCSMCHSIEGKGNKNAPLDGVGSKMKPEEIRKYIVSPKETKPDSKMKAYPGMAAADLDALVAYLASLKKKD